MGDSESEYDWEAEELGEEESDVKQTGRKQNSRRFSPAQVACLKGYFSRGMTGVVKDHACLIEKAVKDTELKTSQIKVSLI